MARLQGMLAALSLVSCARAPSPPSVAPAAASAPHAPVETPPASDTLGKDARYVDLVRAALAREGRAAVGADCLLATHAGGYTLRAALAPAVRPLPLPPEDLDPALKDAHEVAILSAWGRYGDGAAGLSLASFTLQKPTRHALALLITDRGFALRGTRADAQAAAEAPTLEALLAALDEPARAEATLFVAAEAAVPMETLSRVLAALADRERTVALAVTLAPGTALPTPASARAEVRACPDGLPETAAEEGRLSRDALSAGVSPLRQQASDCVAHGDAAGAAGGKLELAIRVEPAGTVQEACITRDEIGDPGVLACVLGLARGLTFAPPRPRGVVDVGLPIVLLPSGGTAQRALCGHSVD